MIYELERIDELLSERSWTRYRLAKEMNDNPTSINNMFHRTSTPGVPMLRRVCAAFGITMAEFYRTDGIMTVLTPQQKELLDYFTLLDAAGRDKAIAFVKGLSWQDRQSASEDTP